MSQTTRRIALLACITFALAVLCNVAQAQTHTITVLHNFTGGNDGAAPDAGLTMDRFDGSNGERPIGSVILDAAGNIYGTTAGGGANREGTVWMVAP